MSDAARAHVHTEECYPKPGDILCLLPGPTKELKREPAGDLWCFGCRRHLPHDWVLFGDEEPSYYDPVWVRHCSRCAKDLTAFPGSTL
jgi:hypothetical protein